MPRFSDSPFAVLRRRSVSNGPGSRPLMVTLLITVLGDGPGVKPVRPARAPLERPRMSIGAFTAAEVMLTIRPNLRAIMPSTVALISSVGVSMLASNALIQSSRVQLRKSPGGGPPALLMRISGSGQAFSTASRPAGVVMSPTISVTVTPGLALRISSAVFFRPPAPRAVSVTWTPSLASAMAQARPRPLLEAQTMARRPLIPRSTVSLPYFLHDFRVWTAGTVANPGGPDKGPGRAEMHEGEERRDYVAAPWPSCCFFSRSMVAATSGGSARKPLAPAAENSGRRCDPVKNAGWRPAGNSWSKIRTKEV